MHDLILRAWHYKNVFYYLVLIPLSWVFALAILLRRWCYKVGLLRSYKLAVPVIIIGNINVGGSGKTPVVMWLVEQLKQNGYSPGVISRGYGAKNTQSTSVHKDSSADQVGDEPLLIARRSHCPVWIGADRVDVGKALLSAQPKCDIIVSDDGLQHYRLQRNIEVVVVDEQTSAHQRLLPAGPLREPFSRLQIVDVIICNGTSGIDGAFEMQLSGLKFYNLENPTLQVEAEYFKHKNIKALAGIGRPERFFDHLTKLGLDFKGLSFEDHHTFTAQDLDNIECEVLLMTEKDAVKCQSFSQAHYWVLPVEVEIDAELFPIILKKIQKSTKE